MGVTDNNGNTKLVPWYTLKSMGLPYQITYIPPPFPHPISVTFSTPVMNLTSGYANVSATIVCDDIVYGLTMTLMDPNTGKTISFPHIYTR